VTLRGQTKVNHFLFGVVDLSGSPEVISDVTNRFLKLGRQNDTVTGYAGDFFGKVETPLTPPGGE